MNIPKTIAELRTQVKKVAPERMHPAFHFNTKFCHLLNVWDRSGQHESPAFGRWCDLATDLVACLPPSMKVFDGETLELVDPFLELRDTFRSNRRGEPRQIPSIVAAMMNEARGAGLEHTMTDHENLVELATLNRLIPQQDEEQFFRDTCGRITPRQAMQDMISELEAESALGQTTLNSLPGNITLATHTRGKGGIGEQDGLPQLFISGYGGCLCRFPLLVEDNSVIVLQEKEHQGTSVTNLAEPIFATVQEFFPNHRIFEAYAFDFTDEKAGHLAEISIGSDGQAGWSYTEAPGLLERVRQHLQGPEIEI